jgi:hypothetical protein
VTVFADVTPIGWENGNVLFVGRTPFDSSEAPLERPMLTDIESVHPILRNVDLSKVVILRSRSLALPASGEEWVYEAPLRSFDNPLLICGERKKPQVRRVAALGLDLAATDLPLRIAFPLLISNSIHWLAGTPTEPRLPVRCGEVISLAADERVIAEPPVTNLFQPLQNGFYETERGGRREWIAVNTASEEESNLAAPPMTNEAGDGSAGVALPQIATALLPAWPPWRYLALAAVFLATMEWSLFHRRRTE